MYQGKKRGHIKKLREIVYKLLKLVDRDRSEYFDKATKTKIWIWGVVSL